MKEIQLLLSLLYTGRSNHFTVT